MKQNTLLLSLLMAFTSASAYAAIGDKMTDGAFTYEVTSEEPMECSLTAIDINSIPSDVVIPETVQSYAVTQITATFERATSLVSLSIPDCVSSIPLQFCDRCTSLQQLTLGNGLTEIPKWAFIDCSSLSEVIVPEGIHTLYTEALRNCKNMAFMSLPTTLQKIEPDVFDNLGKNNGCSMTITATTPPACDASAFSGAKITKLTVPRESVEKYRKATGWNSISNITKPDYSFAIALDGGKMVLPDAEGMKLQLLTEPGYKLHSLTINGTDVTEQMDENGYFTVPELDADSELQAVYARDTTTSQESADADLSAIKLRVFGKRVIVDGCDDATVITAYDIHGGKILSTHSKDFTIDYSGVIVMQIGKKTFKFAI